MIKEKSSDRLFVAGMVLSMICWGFSWTSGKILSSYGNPLAISFLRFAITFVTLLVIVPAIREQFRISRKSLSDMFIAAVMISVYTFLFFKGLTVGKAGAGGVLVTVMNPVIAYGIMLILAGRKPTGSETAGLLLGLVAGMVLLKLPGEADLIFSAGNIYFLLASFCWAILSVFTARSARHGSSITFSLWMYGVSTLLVLLFVEYAEVKSVIHRSDMVFWGNLFFSGSITTSIATTFYFYATSRVGASKASSFIFMVPFSAALGSWIFLEEVPETHTVIGGLLGIAAVYVLNRKR
jgi:drug/metabolite transporter (DMT)-like permease